MIRSVETLEELSAMRDEWNALLASSTSRSVFLTHEWLCTWWKHLGEDRRLRVLTSHDGGRLIGILPLALRPSELSRMTPSMWEFLGSGIIGSDYLDVIVRSGAEKQALADFADYLDRAGALLQLSQLRRGASTAEELATALTERGWTGANSGINVCPFIDLSGRTWESYFSSLGSSQRYNFQRRLKNLEKSPGFRFECARTAGEADAGLDTLIGLHEKRWLTRNASSEAFLTPAIRAFHKEFCGLAAERG
jgi:CelD/BcsL family acetyltransferase involved in cellulose biosynthesis